MVFHDGATELGYETSSFAAGSSWSSSYNPESLLLSPPLPSAHPPLQQPWAPLRPKMYLERFPQEPGSSAGVAGTEVVPLGRQLPGNWERILFYL